MAVVGINFGSATGGTGFDVAGTVASIMAIQRTPETAWNARLASLKAQDTALTALGTDLSNLSTALSGLTAFDGAMSAKSGASSDSSVAELLSADFTAHAGTHTLLVTSLAQTAAQNSNVVSSTDTLAGTFTLQVGGKSTTITLDSTNNTLAGLAAAINASGAGVTADVITGTSGSRISLMSQTSGLAGDITTTSSLMDTTTSTAVNFQVSQAGKDAVFSIDGIDMTSSSNTVTSAIPGVTMQLLSASPTTGTQMEIVNDTSAVTTALTNFVSAYNKLVTDLTAQEGNDSTGAPEPLYGSSVLSQIQSQISLALGKASAGSGSLQYLTQLGITTQPGGTLLLDSSTLSKELNTDFNNATTFFQNVDSFGQNLLTTLNGLGTTGGSSTVKMALSQNADEESNLNANTDALEARLTTYQASLTAELNAANQILQSIPQQLHEVDEIYAALTGFGNNK